MDAKAKKIFCNEHKIEATIPKSQLKGVTDKITYLSSQATLKGLHN